MLYIILFLHQTTTSRPWTLAPRRCISSFSYIKPQLGDFSGDFWFVVYHPFPTSNHNIAGTIGWVHNVVYHPFPTSNHNVEPVIVSTTFVVYHPFPTSNHNRLVLHLLLHLVVYHPFPTSNHNLGLVHNHLLRLYIILFLHQTTTSLPPVVKSE